MIKHTLTAFAFVAFLSTPTLASEFKWGALAIDTEKAEAEPFYGVGGGDTEQQASDNALSFCKEDGAKECRVLVTYQQCGALAVTGKGDFGWGMAPTKEDAEKQSLLGCKSAECKVVVSDCNE